MTAHTAASLDHPDMRRWLPAPGSADADLLSEQGTIVSRSRDLARNHGVADGALQTLTDNIIGTGLRLCATPDYRALGKDKAWAEAWSNQTEALWRNWAESRQVDAGHALSFDGLTIQMFRSAWLNGDALCLPLWLPGRFGSRFATRLMVVEADRLSNPGHKRDSKTMRGGIELDEYGAALAYWVRKSHPGDAYAGLSTDYQDWERIPATTPWGRQRVIHLHDKERAGQSRGKPSLTSVMRQFKVLGDFQNAELKAAVVNAMVAMVTESNLDPDELASLLSSSTDAGDAYRNGLSQRKTSSVDFQSGRIIPLAMGEKLSGFTPARPSENYDPFVTSVFRHIATGLNIPYELLMKDFSRTNYSSARAALIEAWRYFKGRRQWMATEWARPVYDLWLEEAIGQGLVDAPGFYEHRSAWTRCRWIGAGRGWVDPVKEAQAAQLRMQIGVSTLEAECAEQGLDWEEVIEQRATEKARLAELGLELDAPAKKAKAKGKPKDQGPDDEAEAGAGDDTPKTSPPDAAAAALKLAEADRATAAAELTRAQIAAAQAQKDLADLQARTLQEESRARLEADDEQRALQREEAQARIDAAEQAAADARAESAARLAALEAAERHAAGLRALALDAERARTDAARLDLDAARLGLEELKAG